MENNKQIDYQNIRNEFVEAREYLELTMVDQSVFDAISKASDIIVKSFKVGGKLIVCGNGGSMADAMHFASELTGRYRRDRKPLPAIAISDPAYLSCVVNDYSDIIMFTRYLQAMAKPEDVVFAITTSGNSKNIVHVGFGRDPDVRTIGVKCPLIALTGRGGGDLAKQGYVDCEIRVPGSPKYADRVQEIGLIIIHILCVLIEKKMNL